MSKFFDAQERLQGKTPEPTPAQVSEAEQGDGSSEAAVGIGGANSVPSAELTGGGEELCAVAEPSLEENTEVGKSAQDPSRKSTEKFISDDPLHPAYERITQKLLSSKKAPRQGVVLVAASVSGEGASTVARNTALALGRDPAARIILVDTNIRTPSQHVAFKTDLFDGLCEVLRGSSTLTPAVRTDAAPGLSLLTAGRLVESPPQLLTYSALQGILMALTSLFDWVVIDGPPITSCPEAASLAAASGAALLVVRAERTREEVVEEAKKVLEESGVDVLGAVLNRRRFHIPDFIYRRL